MVAQQSGEPWSTGKGLTSLSGQRSFLARFCKIRAASTGQGTEKQARPASKSLLFPSRSWHIPGPEFPHDPDPEKSKDKVRERPHWWHPYAHPILSPKPQNPPSPPEICAGRSPWPPQIGWVYPAEAFAAPHGSPPPCFFAEPDCSPDDHRSETAHENRPSAGKYRARDEIRLPEELNRPPPPRIPCRWCRQYG